MAERHRPRHRRSPNVRFAGKVAIVDRARCKLERVWTPARTSDGLEAARMQARRDLLQADETAFFEPPGSTSSGFVNVWICRLEDLPTGSDKGTIWIPESFLKEPGADGPRLVSCKQGYEGQVWMDRTLISTRWWPEPPDLVAWQAFIEGTDASAGLPVTASVNWLEIPDIEMIAWRRNLSLFSLGRESVQRAFAPQKLALVGMIALLLPFSYLGGAEFKTRRLTTQVEATLAPLIERDRRIAESQRQAFSARAFATAMAESGSTMAVVDALSELPAAAGGKPLTIIFLGLSENQLEVHLAGVDASAVPGIVTQLDESNTWSEVSGAINRTGNLVLKGNVGKQEGTS